MTTRHDDPKLFSQACTFGDGTDSPSITLNKSGTGTDSINMQAAGVLRGRLQLDASENLILSIHDSNGASIGSLTLLAADGGAVLAKALTISTGGLEVAAGLVKFPLTAYADNAAALAGGLTAGMLYRTGGDVKVVT